MRLAISGRFYRVRANAAFAQRIDALWDTLNLQRDEKYTAPLLADARIMGIASSGCWKRCDGEDRR